jgi:hypothetical protein
MNTMKKYSLIPVMLLFFSSGIFGQGIYNNGAKIVIGTGATVNISGTGGNYRNETNVTNGSMDLSGTLKIAGNLTNNVIAADVFSSMAAGSGVAFTGTTSQTVGGTSTATNTFSNLIINNSSGIVLAKNTLVNGTMTFTSGMADIGNNNFTFGPLAVVAGTPSAASMIIATGSGQVMRKWLTIGTFTFPVGDNNLTAKYSPVSLNFTSATFTAGAYAGLNLVNARYNDPSIAGSYLNRYWNVSQSGITAFACNAMFQYLPGDVTGTESSISSYRMIPAPIATYGPTNVALQQLNATGLTSFGTFTGGSGIKNLNLTAIMLQGLYSGAGIMVQARDALGPHWPSGIADHITVELHSALAGTYGTIIYSAIDVPLSTTGTATLTVPAIYNGSYYITIRHRNSLETTTALAVSFAASTVTQSYGALADVFGSNLGMSIDGHYMIYAGDVNQDGITDFRDYISVDNDSFNFASGYLTTDIDGNGTIDFRDYISIDNNNFNFIGTSHP